MSRTRAKFSMSTTFHIYIGHRIFISFSSASSSERCHDAMTSLMHSWSNIISSLIVLILSIPSSTRDEQFASALLSVSWGYLLPFSFEYRTAGCTTDLAKRSCLFSRFHFQPKRTTKRKKHDQINLSARQARPPITIYLSLWSASLSSHRFLIYY